MQRKRRAFSGADKVAILRQHLIDRVAVSDLCDEHGLQPTLFYRWQKAFFDNGATAFDSRDNGATRKLERENAALRAKLTLKDEVIAEIMEEHVALKKGRGEP